MLGEDPVVEVQVQAVAIRKPCTLPVQCRYKLFKKSSFFPTTDEQTYRETGGRLLSVLAK
jgi:hypothetical protein